MLNEQKLQRLTRLLANKKEGMKAQLKQFELEDKYGALEQRRREDAADAAEMATAQADMDREAAQNAADFDAIYDEQEDGKDQEAAA